MSFRRVCAALALVSLVGFACVPGAGADDGVIKTQPYMSLLNIAKLRENGFDGKGVKIALIDSRVDTTVPELEGINVTNKTFCNEGFDPTHVGHGTSVLMVMASKYTGWAPNATYTVYGHPLGKGGENSNLPENCRRNASNDFLLNQALNDKNDIVVITTMADFMEGYPFEISMARATEMGVPVVIAAGNEGKTGRVSPAALANGAVAVGADDLQGVPLPKSNRGEGLTIMAPGQQTNVRAEDATGKLTRIVAVDGTSVAAPHVGGLLALAKQKWPKANGNQLIRTLISTAVDPDKKWDAANGYGNINVNGMLATDPGTHPTTNPLMNKCAECAPSAKDLADFRDGLVTFQNLPGNNDYIYRGNDKLDARDFPPERQALGSSPRFKSASPTTTSLLTEQATSSAPEPNPSATATWVAVGAAPLAVVGGLLLLRKKGSKLPRVSGKDQ